MSIWHHSCWDIFCVCAWSNRFIFVESSFQVVSNLIYFFDKITASTLQWSNTNTFCFKNIKNNKIASNVLQRLFTILSQSSLVKELLVTIVSYFQKPTNIPMHGAKPFIQMYKAHWKPPPTTNYWPFHRSDKLTIAKGKSLQVCAKEHICYTKHRMS